MDESLHHNVPAAFWVFILKLCWSWSFYWVNAFFKPTFSWHWTGCPVYAYGKELSLFMPACPITYTAITGKEEGWWWHLSCKSVCLPSWLEEESICIKRFHRTVSFFQYVKGWNQQSYNLLFLFRYWAFAQTSQMNKICLDQKNCTPQEAQKTVLTDFCEQKGCYNAVLSFECWWLYSREWRFRVNIPVPRSQMSSSFVVG